MAATKMNATAKTVGTKVEAAPAEVEATTVKTAPAKEAAETVKVTEKKKPGRKPGVKMAEKHATAEKRATAEKHAAAEKHAKAETVKTAAKRTSVKKKEIKIGINVQYAGKSYSDEELVKIAKDVWKYDLKKKAGDLTDVELYVKPEENMVYYVFNGGEEGCFSI